MTNAATLQITTPTDCEIAMTRVFDAPHPIVFEALIQPALLKRWLLGPPGWTMTVCEVELRVGGGYRYQWSREDGKQMGVRGVFLEVEPPERCVQTEKFDQPWYPGEALVTMVLAEDGGNTTMTTRVRYESHEISDSVRDSNMAEGVSASYDRLAGLFTKNSGLP